MFKCSDFHNVITAKKRALRRSSAKFSTRASSPSCLTVLFPSSRVQKLPRQAVHNGSCRTLRLTGHGPICRQGDKACALGIFGESSRILMLHFPAEQPLQKSLWEDLHVPQAHFLILSTCYLSCAEAPILCVDSVKDQDS